MKPLLRGAALRAGDTIGIVAPASGFDEAALLRGVARLEAFGYRAQLGRQIHRRTPQYFAGTAQERVDDLHAMFRDERVGAILCARGGYGSQQVLPLLDLDLIRAHAKPVIGCSDVTALQLWLLEQCGVVSVHGPMAAGDFAREDGVDAASWEACVSGESQWHLGTDAGMTPLREGKAEGVLWGGCLSLLVATLGTSHELLQNVEDDIVLFVEDIGEKPYKIERMFSQWRDAGKLARVRGIIFGEMLDCEQPGAGYRLRDVIARLTADLDGPVATGLRSGHVSRANVSLPMGVRCKLVGSGDSSTLEITEAATIAS